MIVRTTRLGAKGNSKPCSHCLCVLSCYLKPKGYCLRNIYYTGRAGEVIQSNLKKLLCEEPHVSKFYRERGFEKSTVGEKKHNAV